VQREKLNREKQILTEEGKDNKQCKKVKGPPRRNYTNQEKAQSIQFKERLEAEHHLSFTEKAQVLSTRFGVRLGTCEIFEA